MLIGHSLEDPSADTVSLPRGSFPHVLGTTPTGAQVP